jgi:hypothetical protein
MAIPKQVDAQRDFTAGELDPTAKRRDDDEFMKKGMRQLSNARVLNTGPATNRPGRNALAVRAVQPREEDVLMAPGVTYRLSFTNGNLTIYNSAGTQVFTEGGRVWTAATLHLIIFAVYQKQIFITCAGAQPEVLTWDGATTWTSALYVEDGSALGNKKTPFYRISPKGITMLPSANVGNINITFSANVLQAGHVGTRMRYVGAQITITGVTDGQHGTATVNQELFGTSTFFMVADPTGLFNIGDLVEEATTGAEGLVVSVTGPSTNAVGVQNLNKGWPATGTLVGPLQNLPYSSVSGGAPFAVAIWDEQVMDAFHGWPVSCFIDQGRLGFCNFPSVPGAIVWSAEGVPTTLDMKDFGPALVLPSDAIFELVPGKNRVLYVLPGPESAEMVFCDAGVFYIPITVTNPLKPGSVQFLSISSDGAGQVQPRRVGNIIVFADGGLNQLQSIIATGAYYRPFEITNLTDLHAHLFNNIQTIALPSSVTQFPERYAYVLNGDGTVALGKYVLDKDGQLAGKIGWLPWSGAGAVKWVAALNDAVIFSTAYTAGATTAFMLEQLDATLYLDASIPVNAIPTALTPPGGKGPLWWLPTATVDLMDGLIPLGPHATDANGFLVPTFPGEDFSSATLRAGFMWTGVWEPFMPGTQPGQDVGQRMKKRRARLEAYVMNSTGFRFAKLAGGEGNPNQPVAGTIVADKRIPAYNLGDDATKAPPLRERAYHYQPLGRAHDPRNAIVKDTPGSFTLVELAARISV